MNSFSAAILCVFFLLHVGILNGQTLIINEFSNGPSGSQEYVEFVVVDNTVVYDCSNTTPPCIDIRGWIFDDNSGYHGTNGQAPGAVRFSNDPIWGCVPLGTIILVYNGLDPNVSLPADDFSLTDGNCFLVMNLENAQYFEFTETTPGDVACSYPTSGWGTDPFPDWSNVGMSNGGDCARIVDLNGCEVFSVCYGTCNQNNLIYFNGSGSDQVYSFVGSDPYSQTDWISGCAADISNCGSDDQTPGAPNSVTNANYIAQFNNNCSPITPLVSAVSLDPVICGCANSATASAYGSIGPYTYEWTDDAYQVIGQTTAQGTNLCNEQYYVIVTSSIGCADTLSVDFSGGVSGNAGQDNSVSFCSASGSIDLFVEIIGTPDNGGVWSGPSSLINGQQGTFDFASNIPGDYFYIIVGTGGCPNDTATITVSGVSAPHAGADYVVELCSDASPLNLFDGFTGSPETSGSWQGPSALSGSHIGTFDPSVNSTGVYEYVVIGQGSCINDTAFVSVNVQQQSSPGLNGVVILCENDANIDLFNQLMGNPDVGGIWTPLLNSGTSLFNPGLDAGGTYTYQIPANGVCGIVASQVDVTLNQMPIPTQIINDVSCNGMQDGSVDLTFPTGGSTAVTWTLPNGSSLNQQDLMQVGAGIYDFTATSPAGCIFNGSLNIAEPPTIQLQVAVTDEFCPDDCNGVIDASAVSAVGGEEYSLDGLTFQSSGLFNNVCSGNYDVHVQDANGCIVTSNISVTSQNQSSVPTIAPIGQVCEGGAPLFLTADILGGVWSGNGVDAATEVFDPVIAGLGSSQITYTTSGVCGGVDQVVAEVVPLPDVSIQLSSLNGCAPFNVSIENTLSSPNIVSCVWDMGNGDLLDECGVLNYTYNDIGCYDISLQVTNTSGCSSFENLNSQVCALDSSDATFSISDTIIESGNNFIELSAQSLTEDSYSWTLDEVDFGSGQICSSSVDGIESGVYEICLFTENSNGCMDSSCVDVEYRESFAIYVPNCFTPDDDAMNDLFGPVIGDVIPQYLKLEIFNRWGDLVFVGSGNEYWDGTHQSKSVMQGVYNWKIEYKLEEKATIYYLRGHVTVLRK